MGGHIGWLKLTTLMPDETVDEVQSAVIGGVVYGER